MATLKIQKRHHLPVHVQLREQLKYQIETGLRKAGSQLPTVRELAVELHLNYNTIREVYKDLERKGYVFADQGRGVFVSAKKPASLGKREKLDHLIQDALLEAKSLGLSSDDLLLQTFSRAAEEKMRPSKIRLLFLECNSADLKHHINTIRKNLGILSEGCLFPELKKKKSGFLSGFHIVATTMYHYFEVKEMVGPEIDLLGMVVQPSLSKVVSKIAALPASTEIGLICTTESNAKKMKQALIGNGLTHVKFVTSGLDKIGRLESIFRKADEVFVSRMGLNAHSGSWPLCRAVRMYEDDLDPRALSLLRQEISTHQESVLNF